MKKIQEIVADYFKITVNDMKSKKKDKKIVYPRQIAIYLCRKHTSSSFTALGIAFGGKNHSTMIYTYYKIQEDIERNTGLENIIKELENIIKKENEYE